ncbi:MAG TPA: TolC family protein [Desulfobacteraceae bacterium]|nr:TolC family protein [Desulfobacteraceae bacterium]
MRFKYLPFTAGVVMTLWFAFWFGAHVVSAGANERPEKTNSDMQITFDETKLTDRKLRGVITLKDAISTALVRNPDLMAFSIEIRAQEAQMIQAGLFPNPEFQFQSEDFGGSGTRQGFDLTETTVQLSQLIELGGKRSKRKMIASLDRDLAGWDYKSKRADVLTKVTKAFIDVLADQKRVALAKEMVDLAAKVLQTVSARVKAGKVSPIEETRAKVAFFANQIALQQAKRRLEGSRKQLATTWGAKTALFDQVKGRLDVLAPVPSIEALEGLISGNPDIARWATEMEQRNASLALAKAKKIPDPTVSLGGKHYSDLGENAFMFSISIPIPIFDRNQGGISKARERVAKAREERQAATLRGFWDLAETYRSLSSAYSEALGLQTEVLPGATAAFKALRKGYHQGKFDYLSLLDAQRTLFESKGQYIEALRVYHQGIAEVERLIGTGFDAAVQTSNKDIRSASYEN